MSDELTEIRNEFLVESKEMLEQLDQQFVTLESDPRNTELLNEIFRVVHSMKGSAGFLGFTRLVEITHRAESVLNKLRQSELVLTPEVIDVILEAVDVVKALMEDIRESGTDTHVSIDGAARKLDHVLAGNPSSERGDPSGKPSTQARHVEEAHPPQAPGAPHEKRGAAPHPPAPEPAPKLGEVLFSMAAVSKEQILEALDRQEQKPLLGEVLVQSQTITKETLEAALHKQAKSGSVPKGEEEQTVRVDTRRLDTVMNLVGELVLGRNRLMKIGSGLEQAHESDPMVRELGETLAQLNLVTTDLQLAVMKTRMLPIRKVLAKFPRMVRDLSQKLRKQVRLELHGEETELDKSVVDEIGDPLVHLVRNAVDHGIELPEERVAAGKPPEGIVRIAACQEGNGIVIRIEDDGRGLQIEKIKAKALAQGLVGEAELAAMEPHEIMNLIFLPGFSTAERVTDVSGRGVGMDVVRTNIRRINGTVEIDSIPGRGSRVTITLPLTIAIIQALLVEVERSTFAIPLSTVIEAVKIARHDIKTINGREVLNLRERVLPLVRLANEFEIPSDPGREGYYVIVAALGEKRVGVIVDRLRSQEEVVLKSLGEDLADIKGIAGATITGEGKVVLILDIAELVEHVRGGHLTAQAV
jgi:two-component system chemotaxis sensor kinase CheA